MMTTTATYPELDKLPTRLADALREYAARLVKNYTDQYPKHAEYKATPTVTFDVGPKYIRVWFGNHGSRSAHSFIVRKEKTSRPGGREFVMGDILKPAGWKAPETNAARGNILDNVYPTNWTGAAYLR